MTKRRKRINAKEMEQYIQDLDAYGHEFVKEKYGIKTNNDRNNLRTYYIRVLKTINFDTIKNVKDSLSHDEFKNILLDYINYYKKDIIQWYIKHEIKYFVSTNTIKKYMDEYGIPFEFVQKLRYNLSDIEKEEIYKDWKTYGDTSIVYIVANKYKMKKSTAYSIIKKIIEEIEDKVLSYRTFNKNMDEIYLDYKLYGVEYIIDKYGYKNNESVLSTICRYERKNNIRAHKHSSPRYSMEFKLKLLEDANRLGITKVAELNNMKYNTVYNIVNRTKKLLQEA